MKTVLPRIALDLGAPPGDLRSLYPNPVEEIRLEIGFGGGEHMTREARMQPHVGFIGVEPFMNGMAKALYAGDMIMRDAGGVACCILYGQDNRSPISPATSHVLYVAYAPTGVGAAAVEAQLRAIEENVRLFCPAPTMEQRRVIAA